MPNRFHFILRFSLAIAVGSLACVRVSAVPPLPVINTANVVKITNFGAVSSTTLTNTTAIQSAINSAATTNGGCTVEIPAGTYLSGPLTLKSSINLQVDSGALLQMLPMSAWPNANTTFISGSSLHDVEISGTGTIDGQGADWWGPPTAGTRPNFIQFSGCNRVLVQNVTLQNPPTFHLMLKNNNANLTIQGITINTPGTSPNTDGMDIASTNMLIQNCSISDGDDNIEIGGSQLARDILVTNCTFGTGHGVSFGSITSGGVSNVMVVNCTNNGTDYGIRLKSDNAASGGGSGGLCQNLFFANITMTNIVKAPIVIYSYYNEAGTPTSITPMTAATEPVASVTSTTVVWRNITFSNLTINTPGVIAGIIWGRLEMPVTNVSFSHVNISAAKSFDIYNAVGVQFADSQITLPAGNSSFTLFNARLTVTNSSSAANLVTLDGLSTNGYGNSLAFYNAPGSLKNTNAIDDGPLTLGASTFAISNNFALVPSTVLNFQLGTNAATIQVSSNLTLGGTINVTNGAGFTNGTYTLLTYGKNLNGTLPTLGSTPAGYVCTFDTNTLGQVKLIASLPAPAAPTNLMALGTNLQINLRWNAVSGATSYNLKRGITSGGPYPTIFSGLPGTNDVDGTVTDGVTYYYVVTAVAGGESTNSLQASAASLPSTMPTNLVFQTVGSQLRLSWPQDHLGWRLQIQTNSLTSGLGTNWFTVANSTNVDQMNVPLDPANGSVFLRLVYP